MDFFHIFRLRAFYKVERIPNSTLFFPRLLKKVFGYFIKTLLDNLFSYLRIKLVFLREERIGHQIGDFAKLIEHAKKLRINENTETYFIFSDDKKYIANLYVQGYFRKLLLKQNFKIFFKNSNLIISTINFLCEFNILRNCKNIFYKDSSFLKIYHSFKEPLIKVSDNYYSLCQELEITPFEYVCIYSREDAYLNERFSNIDWSYHKFRNSDINKKKLISDYIVNDQKISVIRVGSKVNNKLNWASKSDNSKNPKIVDYSRSKYQSDKNDIDIIAGAKLFVCDGGGVSIVAHASKRNLIGINSVPIGISIFGNIPMIIPALIRRISDNSYLSFKEIVENGLAFTNNGFEYEKMGYYVEENRYCK